MDLSTVGPTVRRGAWAVVACHVASQIISIVTLAVLYRLVAPPDFGIFAMVLVAINFGRLFATWSLGVASVQAQDLTDADQTMLCRDGLKIATITAICLGLLAKPIAWFFGEPKVFEVLASLLLTLIIVAAGTQHQARLERKLQLGRLAACRLAAQLFGATTAICAAFGGLGIWALVVQQFVESISLTATLWFAEPWRPFNSPSDRKNVVHLHRFGSHYTLSSLMFWIAQNFDTILIGRFGGDYMLGLYSQAFNLMMKPVLLVTAPVTAVMLPALSREVSRPQEYRRSLVSFYHFTGLILLPCSVGLFVLADDVMVLLGGDEWRDAGILLRALAPVIAAQGFINIAGSVFASAGRADRLLAGSIAIASLLCQAVAAGWWLGTRFGTADLGGPLGVAVAYSAVTVGAIFLPYLWFCLKSVGVPMRDVMAALWKPFAASLVMGAAVWTAANTMGTTPLVRLIVGIVMGVVVYALITRHEIRALLTTPG